MKKKYLSLLLTFSIVFSSIPAVSVNAAPDAIEQNTTEDTTLGAESEIEWESASETVSLNEISISENTISGNMPDTAKSPAEDVTLILQDSITIPSSVSGDAFIHSYNEKGAFSYESDSFSAEDISGVPYIEQLNLLLNEDAFRNQLSTDFERKLYDAGKKSIIEDGNNYIELGGISKRYDMDDEDPWNDICNVFSALAAAYPNKFNWMNWTNASFGREIYYHAQTATYSYKYTLKGSKHYSKSLEEKADAKVKSLVAEANTYAKENYEESPAYGIIEYFNHWICENNYFEREHGTSLDENVQNKKIYYYSHSCYGPLLYGYGTADGYALAMSRLLDAAGIRNLYVTGSYIGDEPFTEYAWNYVEMPDGYWYLIDTLRNDYNGNLPGCSYSLSMPDDDTKGTNTEVEHSENLEIPPYDYLLIAPDSIYKSDSRKWKVLNEKEFCQKLDYEAIITPAPFDYLADTSEAEQLETLTLSHERVVLKPEQTFQLSIKDSNTETNHYYDKFVKTWKSDNPKIVKINRNGKITAGTTPGKATITAEAAGKTFTCEVFVYQFTNIKFNNNNKTSYTAAFANADALFNEDDLQTLELTVNQKNSLITAEEIVSGNQLNNVTAVSDKPHIAKVKEVILEENTITLNVLPKAVGTAKITISLGGKKAYYTVKITQDLQENWFDYSNIVTKEYNGKKITPKIPLTEAGRDCSPRATYTITYSKNKNAGEATITIKGTGKYTGTITKHFVITPKDMTNAIFKSCTSSKTYNTKALAASTNIRLGKTTLVAGKDYTVLYNGSDIVPTQVGEYEITIVGKGNYAGTLTDSKTYTIKPASIKNVSVTCSSSVKYTGDAVYPTYRVKLGKKTLPEENYKITWLDSAGTEITAPVEKGKYTLVVTPIGGKNIKTTLTKTCIKKKFTVK